MNKFKILFLALLILAVAAACSSDSDEEPTATPAPATVFVATGSGSVTAVLQAIADDFSADVPGYELDVVTGSGTGGGVQGIVDGTLDVAAMSRPPRDSEADEGVEFVQFGTSVTAIMANPDVGVTDLTAEQLSGIFFGEITNWSEVGGPDVPIVVYIRDPEEGNTTDIRETWIGDEEFPETAGLMTSQSDMQRVLAEIEGAIGYGTWGTAVANGADVISLSVDGVGVDNSPESLVSIMGIGYLSDRAEDVQPLVDWLTSEAGKARLTELTIVPVD